MILISEEIAFQSVRCIESVEPVGEREAHGPIESDVESRSEFVFHAEAEGHPRSDRAAGGGEGESESHLQIGGETPVALVAGAVGVREKVQFVERGEVENGARMAVESPIGAHLVDIVGIEIFDPAGVTADEVHAHLGAQRHARIEEEAHRGTHRSVEIAHDRGVRVVEQGVQTEAGAPLFGVFLFLAGGCGQCCHAKAEQHRQNGGSPSRPALTQKQLSAH